MSTEVMPMSLSAAQSSRALFHIFVINAFERAVMALKNDDCIWGPIHISIGQEAVAASVAGVLRRDDLITGSHRAHHISLAKILDFVLPDDWDPGSGEAPEGAFDAVYRTLAEIMGLSPGWGGGRGGSMHLRHPDAGVLGTNAIVSGGVPLSVGAAFARRRAGLDSVVVAFLGDGGVYQGSFHEACNLAGIWKLPVIFVIENNQYAVATNIKDVASAKELTNVASAYGMRSSEVLGYDVGSLHATFDEHVSRARNGEGPALIEVKCYRHFHHGGDLRGSKYGYRGTNEEEEWLSKDAYNTFPDLLREAGTLSEKAVEQSRALAEELVNHAVAKCTHGSPRVVREELWPEPDSVHVGVRSDGRELSELRYSSKSHFTRFSSMKYSDAIAAVTGRWLERDPRAFVLGEEVANFGGGAYGATKGLPDRYPDRVLNTPISEIGFSGFSLGAAMMGMRPIVEIMFPDFTLVAADQIFNQIGKARHMYGNTTSLPLVLRTRVATGCGYGGQHSMDPVGLYSLFSGWRIVAPADSFEFIGLFNTAMHSEDPVLMLEHHALYATAADVPVGEDGAPELDYAIPFGTARVVRHGRDMTVLVYGSMVSRVVAIADQLASEGLELDVIDLRSLDAASIDYECIGASLARTGVIATVEQAAGGHAIGHRLAAQVTERFFDELDAPPGVIAAADLPNPVSRVLEQAAMLSDEQITRDLRAMAKREWK